MSNTQQAYTRYPELQKAVDNCLADRDSLHALRTAINATIEQLEANIPDPETTIVIDMEASDKPAAFAALHGGLTMIMEAENKECEQPESISFVASEAYCMIEEIKKQHPEAMEAAKQRHERCYPAQPKGEVYTREQMFVMFISLVEHSDVVFSAIKESGAETVGESFDYVMTVINNAKTKYNEQTNSI